MENLELLRKIERVKAPSTLWENIQHKINIEPKVISTKWLSAAAIALIVLVSGNIYAAKTATEKTENIENTVYDLSINFQIYE